MGGPYPMRSKRRGMSGSPSAAETSAGDGGSVGREAAVGRRRRAAGMGVVDRCGGMVRCVAATENHKDGVAARLGVEFADEDYVKGGDGELLDMTAARRDKDGSSLLRGL
ncbi:hypothetical protein GUJ93_ZPchr0007g3343 [Zizania palustris]|uniref:Uncharacterized protein n=1 Tax=Zizania palustris TaxID=103762 RepID=A0A8J5TCB7_ZIZPA|nr:hypothetical protein GUJ93_ZPchr0007g3343 [Zizania palustris]